MASDYRAHVACPFCKKGVLRANPALARCVECGTTMDHGFYRTLLQIRALAEAENEPACRCCSRKDRRPGGGSRCPACGGRAHPERDPRTGT